MTGSSKREEYLKILGLPRVVSYEELLDAYRKQASSIFDTLSGNKDVYLKKMLELNNAFSNMSGNCVEKSGTSMLTAALCHKLGMSLQSAKKILEKRNLLLNSNVDLDTWLEKRRNLVNKIEGLKDRVISLYIFQPVLLSLPYEEIICMYQTDCELQELSVDAVTWINQLIRLCNDLFALNSNSDASLLFDEYRIFLDSSTETSFLNHIKDEIAISNLCSKIGAPKYSLQHRYDYEIREANISFKDYLEHLWFLKSTISKLGVSEKKFAEYYQIYLNEGYDGSQYEFSEELSKALPICMSLKKGYFHLKKEYEELTPDEKPSTFISWLEILDMQEQLKTKTYKLIENIYNHQKKNGYTGNIQDLFTILSGENKNNMDASAKPPIKH